MALALNKLAHTDEHIVSHTPSFILLFTVSPLNDHALHVSTAVLVCQKAHCLNTSLLIVQFSTCVNNMYMYKTTVSVTGTGVVFVLGCSMQVLIAVLMSILCMNLIHTR